MKKVLFDKKTIPIFILLGLIFYAYLMLSQNHAFDMEALISLLWDVVFASSFGWFLEGLI